MCVNVNFHQRVLKSPWTNPWPKWLTMSLKDMTEWLGIATFQPGCYQIYQTKGLCHFVSIGISVVTVWPNFHGRHLTCFQEIMSRLDSWLAELDHRLECIGPKVLGSFWTSSWAFLDMFI